MIIGGIQFTDDEIKQVIAEKELLILWLNQRLNERLGYNMKLERLPDGRIVLHPEGNELEILQWIEQTMGLRGLEEQINKFIEQRKTQKDYDELIQIGKEFKDLEPDERKDVIERVKERAIKNRELKAPK